MEHDVYFLSNETQITFLNQIRKSLIECDSFSFSVSFIKHAGLTLVEDEILKALQRGAHGRLITSTYQNFTDVASLKELMKWQNEFPNFLVHIDHLSFENQGFHSKGYLFEKKNSIEIVIGSSNLTKYALERNIEWNLLVISKKDDQIVEEVFSEYERLFLRTEKLTIELIKKYQLHLEMTIEKWDMDLFLPGDLSIVPNSMQLKALKEIRRFRDNGAKRALVVAATASGKTYLAALDVRNVAPKRMLFVVHRDTIINESFKSFRRVIPTNVTFGKLVGDVKEWDADYLFASNILMSNNLDRYPKDYFEYIVIDEVHHSVADTYLRIIHHFEPKFLLGLTATPERMDTKDVFSLFEHNVPYELRLRDALLNDIVVPFRYYGIKDPFVDFSRTNINELVKELSSSTRVQFIDQKIREIGVCSGKIKAIGFCRNIDHAIQMSMAMKNYGYDTIALTGSSNTGERRRAFINLQDENHPLQIIFAIDILNEGVDIPAVNMVLFLRPTESSTIFIQQLGRGLRKFEDKDYLTVLDFIGNNYSRSVQIAIALGTLSKDLYSDKRYLLASVRNNFKNLGLPIEIHIDPLSKEEILQRIEQTNFNSFAFLKQDYLNFKNFLGNKTPKYIDYIENDSAPDLVRIIKRFKSYYDFLILVEEDLPSFSEEQKKTIRYLSDFIPIIRPYEFTILLQLIESKKMNLYDLVQKIVELTPNFNKDSFSHSLDMLQNKYTSEKKKETNPMLIYVNKSIVTLELKLDNVLFNDHIKDLLQYGIKRYEHEFEYCEEPLKRYAHYDRKQFLMAINYENIHDFPTGIWIAEKKVYIFINLHKDESEQEHLMYEDEFLTKSILKWESSTSTTLDNKKGIKLMSMEEVHVFVRKLIKEDGITQPYVYLGTGVFHNPRVSTNVKKTLLFDVYLDHSLPEYLEFEFITSYKKR